jgi:hypothetical protein
MADDDTPTTLDDFRVLAGIGRVILTMAAVHDGGGIDFVRVGMSASEAREMAGHLLARADRVEREHS